MIVNSDLIMIDQDYRCLFSGDLLARRNLTQNCPQEPAWFIPTYDTKHVRHLRSPPTSTEVLAVSTRIKKLIQHFSLHNPRSFLQPTRNATANSQQ